MSTLPPPPPPSPDSEGKATPPASVPPSAPSAPTGAPAPVAPATPAAPLAQGAPAPDAHAWPTAQPASGPVPSGYAGPSAPGTPGVPGVPAQAAPYQPAPGAAAVVPTGTAGYGAAPVQAGGVPTTPGAFSGAAAPQQTAGGGANMAAAQALAGVKTIVQSAGLVLRGQVNEATSLMTASGSALLITLIVLPLMSGLFLATTIAHLYATADSFAGALFNPLLEGLGGNSYYSYVSMDAGDWIVFWIKGIVVGALLIGAIVLTMRACFGLRHTPVTMRQLAGIFCAAVAPMTVILVPAFILYLLPLGALQSLIMVILAIFHSFIFALTFLLCYVGMVRQGRFQTSVAVPYVLLWGVFLGLYYAITMVLLGA